MNEDRVVGTARNAAGKLQERFGNVAGDAKMQASGIVNQVAGAAQDAYGQTRDAATELAATARGSASNFESALRNAIETQPYTAALIALSIGWLFGRMHRPL